MQQVLNTRTGKEPHTCPIEGSPRRVPDHRQPAATPECIQQVFEEQVRRTPSATAVVFQQERLTYAQLNARANQLAHHLRALGVGPEVLVGICVERSLEMVIGLLAILKAGGAYVPLDPAYPGERLAFMLQDTRVPVLLTQERLLERLPRHEAAVLCLNSDWQRFARESEENPTGGWAYPLRGCTPGAVRRASGDRSPTPDAQRPTPPSAGWAENLAYVIYTSGSTGRPKGVQIRHRSVVHLLEAIRPLLQFGEGDIWTVVHSYAFDFSVWEIWGPLLSGGRLVVVPLWVTQSPAAFYELLCSEQVTILNQTPSALRQLAQARREAADAGRGLSLRRIICGGEAFPPELARQLLDWDLAVWNFYGPTEATVWTAVHPVESANGASIPIGRPLAGYRVHLLDADRRPVPAGEPGELYIGGVGLARGYLNRPELTAEKFIPDPFDDQPGARLYRTGDLARCQPDGTLEYLGRMDHQVKIRGFRIELGEIEAALGRHLSVRAAVVTAREVEHGEQRLVAYVVPDPERRPTVTELRRFVQEKLPEYMVPSALVLLEALPLTPNGKVDRQALPAPDRSRPELEGACVAPRDALENELVRIWEAVLGIQPVGVTDSFFDLGGHSLLAARLFALIEKICDQKLPLAALFQAPTVEQLAGLLRQEVKETLWSPLVAIQPGGSRLPFFCIHGMHGNVLCYRELARYLGPDQPVYGLQAQGLDGKQPGHTRVEEMAAHYIREIRAVQAEGPYSLGGLSFGGVVAYEMAQRFHAQGQEVALLAMFDTWTPRVAKPFLQRARCDLETVMRLGPGDRLAYVRSRTRDVQRKMRLGIWSMARSSRQRLGLPLPQELTAVDMIHRQADRDYVRQVYPGRVTLFRAKEQSEAFRDQPHLGWDGLAAGGLEVHEVPGDHESTVKEPHVRVLAEKLRACLERAQRERSGRQPW
jgi:amino acid adenylation domain-containing protein